MANKLVEDFDNTYAIHARGLARVVKVEEAAKELGLLDGDLECDSVFITTYGETPEIALRFYSGYFDRKESAQKLAEVAKRLLPKAGRFDKGFNESNQSIALTTVFAGVRIVLSSDPPSTCTIEKVEEEVVTPEQYIEAHTIPEKREKRVRYVMKGNCDPLLTQTRSVTEEVVVPSTVELAVDEVPF